EMPQRLGSSVGGCVIERLEHQFAARTPIGHRSERAVAVEDRSGDAPVVDAEPRAAGEKIEAGYQLRPVRPVPAGWLGCTADHLVAIGANQHRPAVLRPAENHQGAHLPSGTRVAPLW